MTPTDTFAHARANARRGCAKCAGLGVCRYDHNKIVICDLCCRHDLGWWLLEHDYGEKNGKWCCRAGCGKMVDAPPAGGASC